MPKKIKVTLFFIGIIALFIIGLSIYVLGKNMPEAANVQIPKPAEKIQTATTSPVIGDKEADASINETLNDVLAENDLDSEFADIELSLSEEEDLNQINNLFNDDEL